MRSKLEVAYMFNEQLIYLAGTFSGNPTLNLSFKFIKRFGIFYFFNFCLVLDL